MGDHARHEAAAQQGGGAERQARPDARLHAMGVAYVRFAVAHPDLFLLMFRGERLHRDGAPLRAAAAALLDLLADSHNAALSPARAAAMARAWAEVHGLAMLVIDGQLAPLVGRVPGLTEDGLIALLLAGP